MVSEPEHPGTILREHLHEIGMSQVSLARAIGVTPKTVSLICAGKVRVTRRVAESLAKVVSPARVWEALQAAHDTREAERTVPAPQPLPTSPKVVLRSGRGDDTRTEVGADIIEFLRSGPRTKATLCDECSCSPMTIHRAMTWLRRDVGAPVQFDRRGSHGGGVWTLTDPDYTLPFSAMPCWLLRAEIRAIVGDRDPLELLRQSVRDD